MKMMKFPPFANIGQKRGEINKYSTGQNFQVFVIKKEVCIFCVPMTDFHRDVIAPIYEDAFERYIQPEMDDFVIPIAPVSFFATVDEQNQNPGIIR